jgi:hypothetical protein
MDSARERHKRCLESLAKRSDAMLGARLTSAGQHDDAIGVSAERA